MQYWPLLRERAFGEMDMKTVAEFRRRAAEAGVVNAWDYTPEGGESIAELRIRAGKFFEVRTIGDYSMALPSELATSPSRCRNSYWTCGKRRRPPTATNPSTSSSSATVVSCRRFSTTCTNREVCYQSSFIGVASATHQFLIKGMSAPVEGCDLERQFPENTAISFLQFQLNDKADKSEPRGIRCSVLHCAKNLHQD